MSDEPALAEEIERLIETHGLDAVIDEVKSVTRRKRGRRPLADMTLALPHLLEEVDEWLSGVDIQEPGRVYRMAQNIARNTPGHSREAAAKRIERKLRKHRINMIAMIVVFRLRDEYPYAVCLDMMSRAAREFTNSSTDLIRIRGVFQRIVQRYQHTFALGDGSIPIGAMMARLQAQENADLRAFLSQTAIQIQFGQEGPVLSWDEIASN